MDEKKNGSPNVTYIDVHVGEGADAFVEALIMYGIEYIFINSGTDTFPVQEALARKIEKGEKVPEVILCLDESMGLSAAHGYYQITGKPQAVLVHVDAGTAQLGGALHNAQRSRAAMLIVAGRSPVTFLNEVPGGRDLPIHWIQEQRDQAGIRARNTRVRTVRRDPEGHPVDGDFSSARTQLSPPSLEPLCL